MRAVNGNILCADNAPRKLLPQSPKQIGHCFNASIGAGGALQGPVLGPFGVGASVNLLGGISRGGSWLDSRITVSGQISGFYGIGLYGGFGVTAQGGAGEIAQGLSGSVTAHGLAYTATDIAASYIESRYFVGPSCPTPGQ